MFLFDLDDVDAQGFLVDVGGTGTGIFTFPFVTIESVIQLSARRIGVLNDNNYPFSSGRTPGEPDNDEFIVIRLDRRLRGGDQTPRGDQHEREDHDDREEEREEERR